MSMRPCRKCLENNWAYKFEDDRTITATCNNCGAEVNFEAKAKKPLEEGGRCRKCGGTLVKKESKFRKNKLKRLYYYTHYLFCISCRQSYFIEEFKVINDNYIIPEEDRIENKLL